MGAGPTRRRAQALQVHLAGIAAVYAAAAGGLDGCAVGPNYRPPTPQLPAHYAAAGAQAPAGAAVGDAGGGPAIKPQPDLAGWWRGLEDPELNSLVERAVAGNPDVQIALARLQEARTYEALVLGHALPAIDASGAAGRGTGTDLTRSRAQQGLVSADNAGGLQHINTLGGFEGVWELDVFGKYRRELQAARFDADAAAEARNGVLVTVVGDVVRAYVDLRGAQMRLRVLQSADAVLRESLRLVTLRYEHGITNELDVALATRELGTLQARVETAAAEVNAAASVLAVLVGAYPETLAQELAAPAMIPAMPEAIEPGLPLDLLRRRPDVRQAERELGAATARIGVATADLLPRIALIGAIGEQTQGLGGTPHVSKHVWSFGPGAIWPVLDFGALDAQVEIAGLEARVRLVAYRRTLLTAVEDVDDAVDGLRAESARLRSLGEAMLAAQRAVDLATERYDRGLTDFLNVVDAERQFYDLEAEYANAQVAQGRQFVHLYKSLGGGWQSFQSVPAARRPEPAIIAAFRRVLGADAP